MSQKFEVSNMPGLALFWDMGVEKFLVGETITSNAQLSVDAVAAGVNLNFAMAGVFQD
jgi:hypothetical protein